MAAETGLIDLFVIGGGINGAGFARDAAGRGLSVVLCLIAVWCGYTLGSTLNMMKGT